MKPRARAGGAPPRTPRGLRPCDPLGKTKPPWKAKPMPIPSRWSGLSCTRCPGAYRASGLRFHLTQPRPVWVTSLNDLTGSTNWARLGLILGVGVCSNVQLWPPTRSMLRRLEHSLNNRHPSQRGLNEVGSPERTLCHLRVQVDRERGEDSFSGGSRPPQ